MRNTRELSTLYVLKRAFTEPRRLCISSSFVRQSELPASSASIDIALGVNSPKVTTVSPHQRWTSIASSRVKQLLEGCRTYVVAVKEHVTCGLQGG